MIGSPLRNLLLVEFECLAKPPPKFLRLFGDAWCGNSGPPNQFGVFEKERLNATNGGVTGNVNDHFTGFGDHASRIFERPFHTHRFVGSEEWAGNFVR